MKSGLKAAGEEFILGIYDGFTGLVVQPYTGARDGGATGFVKGVGMGLTGFVLKDLAAIFGPFGYTFKGVHKELLKGRQPTKFVSCWIVSFYLFHENFFVSVECFPISPETLFIGQLLTPQLPRSAKRGSSKAIEILKLSMTKNRRK
jgi:hypothetical protein